MIVSGNFDVTSLQHEAPFKLGVFELPVPRGQPFGEGTLGSAAEASKQPSGVFGITQASRYQEQALDFLRFFTSVTTNRQFAQDTLWLPGLVDLPPPPGAEAFAPRISGEIDGPLLFPSNDSTRFVSLLFQRNLHLLSSPTGGIDRFIAAMESAYKPALRVDLARNMKDIRRGVSRSDTTIAAWRARSDEPNATQKVTQLTDVQQQQELSYYQSAYELARP